MKPFRCSANKGRSDLIIPMPSDLRPRFRKQKCGHSFNASVVQVYPECPRKPARFVAEHISWVDQKRETFGV